MATYPWYSITATYATTNSGYLTNQTVWETWTSATTSANAYQPIGRPAFAAVEAPLPVQTKWRTRQRLIIQANRSRAKTLRLKVSERQAEKLLLESLSERQREEYARDKRFSVYVGDKVYRIRRGWSGNIDLIEDGRVAERWCVHPDATIPVADSMLAQKLMLECGEEADLREIANIENRRRAA